MEWSFEKLTAIAILVAVVFLLLPFPRRRKKGPLLIDRSALDAAERELRQQEEMDWVVLKRCHGPAYNHTVLSQLVIELQSKGIEATYDVLSTSSAEGGVTNFMLKVQRGQEQLAMQVLADLETSQIPKD